MKKFGTPVGAVPGNEKLNAPLDPLVVPPLVAVLLFFLGFELFFFGLAAGFFF